MKALKIFGIVISLIGIIVAIALFVALVYAYDLLGGMPTFGGPDPTILGVEFLSGLFLFGILSLWGVSILLALNFIVCFVIKRRPSKVALLSFILCCLTIILFQYSWLRPIFLWALD